MSHPNYAVAEAYLAAVTAGDLPDSLLTDGRIPAAVAARSSRAKSAASRMVVATSRL